MATLLARQLVADSALNDFMEDVLPPIAARFGAERVSLIDYYEHTDRFELLFFRGYPSDARYQLQRRLGEMEIRRALIEKAPFRSRQNARLLIIPCYFHEILEAAVVCESDDEFPAELSPAQCELSALVSRFLGLFMSSARLEVNRHQVMDPYDLRRARQIQVNFLPKNPPSTGHSEVYGFNHSSSVVGGDYFDYFVSDRGKIQCILADACGHGMAAALIMSNFRGLLQSEVTRRPGLDELFAGLNRMIHFDDEFIQYLTGVFFSLDEETGQIEYVNAGHFEPIVLGRDGDLRQLPGGGPPLGMFKTTTYPTGVAQLNEGDLVALFTDGLVDIRNPAGEYLGIEGFAQLLQEFRDSSLPEATHQIIDRARKFSGDENFEDDVTVFLMRFKNRVR